jgi:hypothetical protein
MRQNGIHGMCFLVVAIFLGIEGFAFADKLAPSNPGDLIDENTFYATKFVCPTPSNVTMEYIISRRSGASVRLRAWFTGGEATWVIMGSADTVNGPFEEPAGVQEWALKKGKMQAESMLKVCADPIWLIKYKRTLDMNRAIIEGRAKED